jgi:energy-coupling factor transporter ATP-binding protein EcfA2
LSAILRTVRVTGLFDKYDYSIGLRDEEPVAGFDDRLRLLYGRNGSGKSTILRLVFHALSGHPNRGHKQALVNLPFRTLAIETALGNVKYEREPDDDATRLSVTVETNEGSAAVDYRVGADGRLVPVDKEARGQVDMLLFRMHIDPVILTDSRQIVSDLLPDEGRTAGARRNWELVQPGPSGVDELVNDQRDEDLQKALQRVTRHLSSLALAGSQEGSGRIDTIYAQVAEGIVDNPAPRGRPAQYIIPQLRRLVSQTGERAAPYAHYELLQDFPSERLMSALDRAPDKLGPTLLSILTPYLTSSADRLDALQPALRTVDTYVRNINAFFETKNVHYTPRQGVKVRDNETGSEIGPGSLSSGEKQLLLLFSYVTALRDSTRLLIIDEPEISLNPDWQRILVPQLLLALQDESLELLLASHSIEILAPHQHQVRDLVEG